MEPTIFTNVRPDMRIAQEEVFGPVLAIMPFDDDEEAIEIANGTAYGLAAGVWTQSIKRALTMAERLEAGTVWVNTYRAVSYMSPFGGYKRSGIGRESGLSDPRVPAGEERLDRRQRQRAEPVRVALIGLPNQAKEQPLSEDVHEVYAITYARVDRRSPDNFLGGDPHDVPMPLNYYVWLVVNGGRTIVVDTGFDQRGAELRRREITKPVREGLAAFGVDLAGVEDVIITHLHYDHCGNDGLFPTARYHLQDSEMAYATGRCMGHGVIRVPFEVEDVVAMVRRVYDGRVVFHDGADEIVPGVTVHHIGGHSRGLQAVRVETRRGHVVLASDVAHFCPSRPAPPLSGDRQRPGHAGRLRYGRAARDLARPRRAGHDPLVAAIYPAARPGTAGWAVRLDADPKPR